MASDSTTMASTAPAQSTTATSAVIIPNKSTMEEEFIDIPYGREARDSGVTTIDERQGDPARDGRETEPPDSASDYPSPMSSRSPPAGLGGLSARLKGVEDEDDLGPGNRSGDDLYDKYGRSSVDSTRSAGGNAVNSRIMGSRASLSEETEKMRRDYEFKIATMQTQITNMQRDIGDAADKKKESEVRVRQLEEELAGFLQVRIASWRCDQMLRTDDLYSGLKNRVQPCAQCKRRSRNLKKPAKEKPVRLKKIGKNSKSSVTAAIN